MCWLMVLCLFAQDSQAPQENWTILRKQWEQKIKPGKAVRVENPFGEIRARGTKDRVSIVTLNQQVLAGESDFFQIEIEDTEQELRIRILAKQPLAAKDRHRLDLSLLVPDDAVFFATTNHGLIEAKGLVAEAKLVTNAGEIKLKSKGRVDARSGRGKIFAVLTNPDWQGRCHFQSDSGTIEIMIPGNADLSVKLKTQEEIASDFSMEVLASEKSPDKTATVVLGSGKNQLVLESARGSVKLKRIE